MGAKTMEKFMNDQNFKDLQNLQYDPFTVRIVEGSRELWAYHGSLEILKAC